MIRKIYLTAFCLTITLFIGGIVFSPLGAHSDGLHGATMPISSHLTPEHPETDREDLRWWKGNLHTHTLWSDGDSFPELVVDWYKKNGYHFLALSDHNVLDEGQKWINPETYTKARGRGDKALEEYIERFGEDWVETRQVDESTIDWLSSLPLKVKYLDHGQRLRYRAAFPPEDLQPELEPGDTLVRLKPFSEYRSLFEEPGKFLMIKSEELTAPHSVHVNATNLLNFIPPHRGEDVESTIQKNISAVYEQRDETGQAMFPHLNHPNFRWTVTVEDMIPIEGLRFFEVYNGHPGVKNLGNEDHPDLDRMWDIVLTKRLAERDKGIVFGLAVDDAHEYHGAPEDKASRPGRGWVVVRSRYLTPEHLISAMEAGDFYASTGVELQDVQSDGKQLKLEIKPESGVEYVTRFIGTREGYDPSSSPRTDDNGNEVSDTSRKYSDDIGEVLAEVEGTSPSYEFTGDEIYVRAKVVSSKSKKDPYSPEEKWEVAWAQPVIPHE